MERPTYGVLAPWQFGPWINYIAERPSTASAFVLSPMEVDAIRTSVDVLLAEKEENAAMTAAASRARYVVAATLHSYLPSYTELQGRSLERLMKIVLENGRRRFWFGDGYFRILNNRMLFFDGSEATAFGVDALGHFRMVYESPYRFRWSSIPQERPVSLPEWEISGFKIFERVAGAVIEGKARPFTRVRAEITIRTNRGRKFLYQTSSRSDEQGVFSLRLPYSTQTSMELQRTVALGPYRIWSTGWWTEMRISEEQVKGGTRLSVSDLRDGMIAEGR